MDSKRGLVKVPGARAPSQLWLVPVETPLWTGVVTASISGQSCKQQRGSVDRAVDRASPQQGLADAWAARGSFGLG